MKSIIPIILWLFLVGVGLYFLTDYSNTSGVAASPSNHFPAASQIKSVEGFPTLIMLVHPHCPCSRASMGELELLMAQSQGRVKTYVLFLKPAEFSDDWEKTDLWDRASHIPDVSAIQDTDAREARLFNGATSGQTFLYDADGKLIFQGGITSARGHSGDNAGRSAIVSLLNNGTAEQSETSVYGCPLFNPDSTCPLPQ